MAIRVGKKLKLQAKSDESSDVLEINEYKLDEEWVGQPKLFGKFAGALAEARKDLEEAKAELEVIAAELDLQIRKDPNSYGLDKATEKAIENCVVTRSKYQKANQAVIDAKFRVDLLSGTTTALDHRKKALEKLVDLRLADYFSEPRAKSREGKEVMDEVRKDKIRRRSQIKR